jgi:capsular polysaccharide biosynthesis protein
MRFLLATIQSFESEFYGRVGERLTARGHAVEHVTYSRRSARLLAARGLRARSLGARVDPGTNAARIVSRYGEDALREAERTDRPSVERGASWSRPRTLAHVRALETLFGDVRPDVLVSEPGTELMRSVAHLVAAASGVPTLWPSYTIFPAPLRLAVDTLQAPIVPVSELRPLTAREREELDRFREEFTRRAQPIRAHRRVLPTAARTRRAAEYVGARLGEDRDNEYLRPGRWAVDHVLGWTRAAAARQLYAQAPGGRFLYLPLHVADDYKLIGQFPEWADQAALVERVAAALPAELRLVVKEHPLSYGRNTLGLLRRIAQTDRVHLLHPRSSSHALVQAAEGVVVLGSTVGLEALLYEKPVLTLGRPFYAGFGVTLDIDPLEDLHGPLADLRTFRPDPERTRRFLHAAWRSCYAGAPVLIDRSDENASVLAASFEAAASALFRRVHADSRPAPVPT